MNKIAIFFAEGFEEIEALTVVDLCRRAEISIDMISVNNHKSVIGSHGIVVQMDKQFTDVNFEEIDMIVLPGGGLGTKKLDESISLMSEIDAFIKQGKMVCAICAAPSILGKRGYLKGKRACCYPSFENELIEANVTNENVEVDGNIITSRGMGTAFEFGLSIVEYFCGKEKREELAKTTIYK